MSRDITGKKAVKMLKEGIEERDKSKILAAYRVTEVHNFDWDKIRVDIFEEFNELVDYANEIIYE